MPALDRHKLDRQHVDLFLPLTAEQRTVLRGRRSTACGREVLLQLPRHGPLEPGDQLFNADASVRVEVKAALEDLLQVQAPTSLDLLAAAYHLGNRHVALELHDQELLLLDDSGFGCDVEGTWVSSDSLSARFSALRVGPMPATRIAIPRHDVSIAAAIGESSAASGCF
jgi:urease accessory protein